MSIACTTCQARLKVRDQRAIGQILPCPRCRSMVHVHASALKTDAQWASGASGTAAVAVPPASYSLPDLPPSDSFDHIDQLLDGAISIRPVRRASGQARWRTGPRDGGAAGDAISARPDVRPIHREAPLSDRTHGTTEPERIARPPASLPGSASASHEAAPDAKVSSPVSRPASVRSSVESSVALESARSTTGLPRLHPEARIVSNLPSMPVPPWSADEPLTQEDVAFLTRPATTPWWQAAMVRRGGLFLATTLLCGGLAYYQLATPTTPVRVESPAPTAANGAKSVTPSSSSASDAVGTEPTQKESLAAAEMPQAEEVPAGDSTKPSARLAQIPAIDTPPDARPEGPSASDTPATPDLDAVSHSTSSPAKPAEVREELAPSQESSRAEGAGEEAIVAPDDELSQLAKWLRQPSGASPSTPTPPVDSAPSAPLIPAARAERPASAPESFTPTRPLPPRVDVAIRLRTKVSACRFQETPLIEVLRSLSDLSTIPITLDPEALGRVGQNANRPVNVDLRNTTVGAVLEAALSGTQLGYQIRDGHVRILTADEQSQGVVSAPHDVADLTRGDARATQALAKWMTQLIAYGSWREASHASLAGADSDEDRRVGEVQVAGSVLQVTHRDTVQFQIASLLDKLRVARGLPTKGEATGHSALGGVTPTFTRFDRPITIQAWRGGSLHQILASIEGQAGIRILVDWESLHSMGWAPMDEWKFICREMALREALPKLLRDTGLSYRVIDSQTLQIVSAPELAQKHDIEVYSLKRPGLKAAEVQKFCQSLAQQFGRDQFQPQGNGALAYDAPSQHLVVSLPQREQEIVQARIVEWLAQPLQ